MIDNKERQQIRELISDPKFRVVEKIANDICDKIKEDSAIKDTQWETLKFMLTQEGEMRGIRRLIQALYNLAKDIDDI